MKNTQRIEQLLQAAIEPSQPSQVPSRLQAAIRHAVFPGGSRFRPHLIFAIAEAYNDPNPSLKEAVAVSTELMHCASLVHDDLPCFDNASTRRGRPSVQRAFGEELAVLVGDALIVLAFENLAMRCSPAELPAMMRIFAAGVGANGGMIAGQAWESEPACDLHQYHRAKTGALFVVCTRGAAQACHADEDAWAEVGRLLGEAYQVADDIHDACSHPNQAFSGKPRDQDTTLGRPNIVLQEGLQPAVHRFQNLVEQLIETIPSCPGQYALQKWMVERCHMLIASIHSASAKELYLRLSPRQPRKIGSSVACSNHSMM